MLRSLSVVLTIVALAGCGGGQDQVPPTQDGEVNPPSSEYARALQTFSEMRVLPSGLWIGDELVGTGAEASPTSTVSVHYSGFLPNGEMFDSSRTRNEPFGVTLGQQMVITGWELGIPGMKVGGRRVIMIPPNLGYGDRGAGGVIPPNAILVFQVELLAVN